MHRSDDYVPPNREMIKEYCRRFGHTPVDDGIAEIIGCSPASIVQKMKRANFKEKEKILIAKEFELTAQEFVDMFYPDVFHPDGNVKLDRQVRYGLAVKEPKIDVFPKYR